MQIMIGVLLIMLLIFSEGSIINNFTTITVSTINDVTLTCGNVDYDQEITEIIWLRGSENNLEETAKDTKDLTVSNITEDTLIICQYVYFNYKYWLEIYLLSKNPVCFTQLTSLKNGLSAISERNTTIVITSASKEPALHNCGKMKISESFTLATCILFQMIIGNFFVKRIFLKI